MKLEEVEKALLALPLVIAEVMEEASMKQRTADHFICRHSLLQREIPSFSYSQHVLPHGCSWVLMSKGNRLLVYSNSP